MTTCLKPLPVRTLQRMARLSCPAEHADAAELGVELLSSLLSLQPIMHRLLNATGLSGNAFSTMIALLALDPTPIAASDLAFHTRATRSATTYTLEHLAQNGWIGRSCDSHDSHVIYVNLTPSGRTLIEREARCFLDFAAELARDIGPNAREGLQTACRILRERADSLGSKGSRPTP